MHRRRASCQVSIVAWTVILDDVGLIPLNIDVLLLSQFWELLWIFLIRYVLYKYKRFCKWIIELRNPSCPKWHATIHMTSKLSLSFLCRNIRLLSNFQINILLIISYQMYSLIGGFLVHYRWMVSVLSNCGNRLLLNWRQSRLCLFLQ